MVRFSNPPLSLKLKNGSVCTWYVKIKTQDDNKVVMDDQWKEFVGAHYLRAGYLLTFKLVRCSVPKVTAHDHSMTQKVFRCAHPSGARLA